MIEIQEPYGFIYITTNMVNGKRYIGQKMFYGKKKWQNYLGSGKLLKKAIKKYEKENFTRDIVDIAYSQDELDKLEIEWIKNYNAIEDENYYNIALGGNGGNTFSGKSEEELLKIKKKISNSLRGNLNPNFGNHKLKGVLLGNLNPMYGKNHSMEAKERMSKARKGKKHTWGSTNKKVICLTTGLIFGCIKQAGDFYTVKAQNISSNCIKPYINKSAGKLSDGTKLKWKYISDLTTEEYILYDIENKLKKLHNEDLRQAI